MNRQLIIKIPKRYNLQAFGQVDDNFKKLPRKIRSQEINKILHKKFPNETLIIKSGSIKQSFIKKGKKYKYYKVNFFTKQRKRPFIWKTSR